MRVHLANSFILAVMHKQAPIRTLRHWPSKGVLSKGTGTDKRTVHIPKKCTDLGKSHSRYSLKTGSLLCPSCTKCVSTAPNFFSSQALHGDSEGDRCKPEPCDGESPVYPTLQHPDNRTSRMTCSGRACVEAVGAASAPGRVQDHPTRAVLLELGDALPASQGAEGQVWLHGCPGTTDSSPGRREILRVRRKGRLSRINKCRNKTNALFFAF